jgi:hypothetical protein
MTSRLVWMVLVSLVAASLVACSGVSTGGGTAAPQGGGATSGRVTATAPDPCKLLAASDVTAALKAAGYQGTFGDGAPSNVIPNAPNCTWSDDSNFTVTLQTCTAENCHYDNVKSLGGDPVAGVGDEAFAQTTCSDAGYRGHDETWTKAKGLVYALLLGCTMDNALTTAAGDSASASLLKLAISKS